MAKFCLIFCYEEDSGADVDMNFVMTAGYKFVEVQATADIRYSTSRSLEG